MLAHGPKGSALHRKNATTGSARNTGRSRNKGTATVGRDRVRRSSRSELPRQGIVGPAVPRFRPVAGGGLRLFTNTSPLRTHLGREAFTRITEDEGEGWEQ